MINAKKHILKTLDTIPDGKNLNDVLYELYVKGSIAQGEDDIKNGRVISHKDLRKEMEVLYEDYNLQ